jgi:hypothetical protein
MWALAPTVIWGGECAGATDLHIWLATMIVCHLLIDSIPALRFIGPAHRYLTYAFLPLSVVMAGVAFDSEFTATARAILLLGFVAGAALAARRLSRLQGAYALELSKMREVADCLKSLPLDRVLVLPMPLSDTLGYFSDKKFLHGWASRAWGVGPRYGIYPVMERPLDDVIEQFELELLVIKKDYVRFEELMISTARKLSDNGTYEVYAVAAGCRALDSDLAPPRARSEYA